MPSSASVSVCTPRDSVDRNTVKQELMQRTSLQQDRTVDRANALDCNSFFQQYLPGYDLQQLLYQKCPDLRSLNIVRGDAKSIEDRVLNQCLDLIEDTSSEDYRKSEIKWSWAKKRKEMALPDMRYIILTVHGDLSQAEVIGFVSFMITYEDGFEVVYCYEIHLAKPLQGKGIGPLLMILVEDIGRSVGVQKAMLTVFKSNAEALKMYQRLGYVEDEFSPQPRRLRNGTVKAYSYLILSKRLQGDK